jgi:hypothetical protein
MPLAYTFWHQPKPDVEAGDYERGLRAFHQQLAAVPIPGFVSSDTLRVTELPWLPGGGYEDWYLVDDFAALATLAAAAVDRDRREPHDVLAYASRQGAGGVYALVAGRAGRAGRRAGWAGWFRKQDGAHYPQLLAGLREQVDGGQVRAAWQRQLVLGPAEEFRVEAAEPVPVTGAELIVSGPAGESSWVAGPMSG